MDCWRHKTLVYADYKQPHTLQEQDTLHWGTLQCRHSAGGFNIFPSTSRIFLHWRGPSLCPNWMETKAGLPSGSATVSRQFVYGHFVYDTSYKYFVYRHFVYYCIPGYRTILHPTSVSANHYFHQFQLLLTLRFPYQFPFPLTL